MDNKTLKIAEDNQSEYETLMERWKWLLLQNSKFRSELETVSKICKYLPPICRVYESALNWKYLVNLTGKDEGIKFLNKYGLLKQDSKDKRRFLDLGFWGDLRAIAEKFKFHLNTFDRDKQWFNNHVINGKPYKEIICKEDKSYPISLDPDEFTRSSFFKSNIIAIFFCCNNSSR